MNGYIDELHEMTSGDWVRFVGVRFQEMNVAFLSTTGVIKAATEQVLAFRRATRPFARPSRGARKAIRAGKARARLARSPLTPES